MSSIKNTTRYAPPERWPGKQVREAYHNIAAMPFVQDILNTFPNPSLILNKYRQVIFANNSMMKLLNNPSLDAILGSRPGEVLNCIFSGKEESGCGTSDHCSACGGLYAFLECHKLNQTVEQESQIMTMTGSGIVSYDMLISATPFQVKKECYYIVNMLDISHEKRRHILERIFFHDILNTAGNINSMSRMLNDEQTKDIEDWTGLIQMASDNLINEIEAQRTLLAAERDELQIMPKEVNIETTVIQMLQLFKNQTHQNKIKLLYEILPDNYTCVTDKVLLCRILTNLIKNSIEASRPGDMITMGCAREENDFLIWIQNPAVIPSGQKLQIFQRSFSTKGLGRGLGTYSIKLLTEKYLKGYVMFSSKPEVGTCFKVRLPIRITA